MASSTTTRSTGFNLLALFHGHLDNLCPAWGVATASPEGRGASFFRFPRLAADVFLAVPPPIARSAGNDCHALAADLDDNVPDALRPSATSSLASRIDVGRNRCC